MSGHSLDNTVHVKRFEGGKYLSIVLSKDFYKLDHFIFQRLMAYKLFLAGVDNFLQSSVPVCYLLAADLEN